MTSASVSRPDKNNIVGRFARDQLISVGVAAAILKNVDYDIARATLAVAKMRG